MSQLRLMGAQKFSSRGNIEEKIADFDSRAHGTANIANVLDFSACHGHFGRDSFPWESIDLVDALNSCFPSVAATA